MSSKLYITICIIIICIGLVLALWVRQNENYSTLPVIQVKNEYFVHMEEMIPREEIHTFLVSKQGFYILYDESSLVNVYRADGTFVYGIQVSSSRNGRADIAYHNGQLLIWTRRSDIFVFQDSTLVDIISPGDTNYVSYKGLFDGEKNQSDGVDKYVLSADKSTIIRQSDMTQVIDLPQISHKLENIICFLLVFAALSLYGYSAWFKRN